MTLESKEFWTYTRPVPGARGMTNTIFVIEVDGVRYCHIGDNRHDVPKDVHTGLAASMC